LSAAVANAAIFNADTTAELYSPVTAFELSEPNQGRQFVNRSSPR